MAVPGLYFGSATDSEKNFSTLKNPNPCYPATFSGSSNSPGIMNSTQKPLFPRFSCFTKWTRPSAFFCLKHNIFARNIINVLNLCCWVRCCQQLESMALDLPQAAYSCIDYHFDPYIVNHDIALELYQNKKESERYLRKKTTTTQQSVCATMAWIHNT